MSECSKLNDIFLLTEGNSSCLGDCSHICLLSPNGSTCACPVHFTLEEDGKTCKHDGN